MELMSILLIVAGIIGGIIVLLMLRTTLNTSVSYLYFLKLFNKKQQHGGSPQTSVYIYALIGIVLSLIFILPMIKT
jgi:hypothetical protein